MHHCNLCHDENLSFEYVLYHYYRDPDRSGIRNNLGIIGHIPHKTYNVTPHYTVSASQIINKNGYLRIILNTSLIWSYVKVSLFDVQLK